MIAVVDFKDAVVAFKVVAFEDARLFKLGELGLFVESLERQTQVSERTEFAELVAGIKSALGAAKGFDTLASDYHAFVVGQLRSAP